MKKSKRIVEFLKQLTLSTLKSLAARPSSRIKGQRPKGAYVFISKKVLGFTLLILSFNSYALATQSEQDVVISAAKVALPANQVGNTVTVLGKKEIEGKENLSEALSQVNSVIVRQNGGKGKASSISIRGANSEQTAIRIDDIEIYDAMGIGRGMDLSLLNLNNISRIEVLAGPQSTLYGSNALAGVVSLESLKGSGKLKGFLDLSGGSYSSAMINAGISGSKNNFYYSLDGLKSYSSGVSAMSREVGASEADFAHHTSFATRLGVDVPEWRNLNIDYVLRYENAKNQLDSFLIDDPNYIATSSMLANRLKISFDVIDKVWSQRLLISDLRSERHDLDLPDSLNFDPTSESDTSFKSHVRKAEWQNTIKYLEDHSLVVGLDIKEEQGSSVGTGNSSWGSYTNDFSKRRQLSYAMFAENTSIFGDNLAVTLGVRADKYSNFDTKVTWKLSTAYTFPSATTLRGSIGTGFKAPSLYQVYSQYGNLKLKPEEVFAFDLGVEQALFDEKLVLGLTYFNSDYKNMIDFYSDPLTFQGQYINIAKARTQGIEASVNWLILDNLSLNTKVNYLDAQNAKHEQLLRRPFWTASAELKYQPIPTIDLALGAIYVGRRMDNSGQYDANFNPLLIKMPDYTLFNLSAAYQLSPNFKVYGRIDNLLDKKYQAIYGYGTNGLSVTGGVKLSF